MNLDKNRGDCLDIQLDGGKTQGARDGEIIVGLQNFIRSPHSLGRRLRCLGLNWCFLQRIVLNGEFRI